MLRFAWLLRDDCAGTWATVVHFAHDGILIFGLLRYKSRQSISYIQQEQHGGEERERESTSYFRSIGSWCWGSSWLRRKAWSTRTGGESMMRCVSWPRWSGEFNSRASNLNLYHSFLFHDQHEAPCISHQEADAVVAQQSKPGLLLLVQMVKIKSRDMFCMVFAVVFCSLLVLLSASSSLSKTLAVITGTSTMHPWSRALVR